MFMKRYALALGGILVFFSTVAIVHGHGISRLGRGTAKPAPVATRTHLLTTAECMNASIEGKVEICHATGSHYNQIIVSVEACINGHAGHESDVLASITGCAE